MAFDLKLTHTKKKKNQVNFLNLQPEILGIPAMNFAKQAMKLKAPNARAMTLSQQKSLAEGNEGGK